MRPAATRFSRAAFVSLKVCFDVSLRRSRGCKFGFGNLDAELLPFSKVRGELLWSYFCLPDRSATRRFQLFSPECEAAKRSIFATALPYHSKLDAMSSRKPYGFHPVSQPNSRIKLNAEDAG
jgi:hypothetical protein